MNKDKSSIITSIFKRKGGEGKYTKILKDHNYEQYSELLLSYLERNEKGLIIYYLNSSNWFILTNQRLLINNEKSFNVIKNSNIKKVNLAMEEEFRDGIRDKKDFTRLLLTDHEDKNQLLKMEKGQSYEGFYQVLHFLSTQ